MNYGNKKKYVSPKGSVSLVGKVLSNKENTIGVFVLGIVLFLTILFSSFISADRFIIEGDKAYINDSQIYISAEPHRLTNDGWVEFNLKSKAFAGNANVVFGFDREEVFPTKAIFYRLNNVTQSFTCNGDQGTYNFSFTTNPNFANCNVTTGNGTVIDLFNGAFEYGNIANRTVTWNITEDWKDVSGSFSTVDYNFDGKNKWHYFSNFPLVVNETYRIKAFLKIEGRGKYDVAFYPSSYGDDISTANDDGNLYYLDPIFDKMLILTNGTDANVTLTDKVEQVFNATVNNMTWMNFTAPQLESVFFPDPGIGSNLDISANFTLMAWINASDVHKGRIMTKGTNSYGFEIRDNRELALTRDGVSVLSQTANNVWNNGTWVHIGVKKLTTLHNVTFYVNGTSLGGTNASTNVISNTDLPLCVGGCIQAFNFFNGTIDEVRIYNKTLNDSEMLTIYENGRGHKVDVLNADSNRHLVLYASFNENDGLIVHDTSVSSINGTVNGSKWQNDQIRIGLIEDVDYSVSGNDFILLNWTYAWDQINITLFSPITKIFAEDPDSILLNITIENNFTHLTIGDANIDFINDTNVYAYYPFDTNTSSSTVYDYSRNNRDGAISGDIHFTENGTLGGAMLSPEGDDSGDYITIGTGNDFGDVCLDGCTFGAWAYKTDDTTQETIIGKWGSTGNDNFFVYTVTVFEALEFDMTSDGTIGNICTAVSANGLFSINEWHHVVGVYSNQTNTTFVYYDGVQVDQTNCTFSSINSLAWQDSEITFISAFNEDSVGNEWNGSLDEIIVLNVSLSDAQVLSLYNNQSSKFFPTGSQEFNNQNFSSDGTGDMINITVNTTTPFGSRINVTIGNVSGTGYSYGLEFSLTDNFVSNITLGTPNNISLKFLFYAGNGSDNSYISPTLEDEIIVDTWFDATVPAWSANHTNSTVFDSHVLFSVQWEGADEMSSYIFQWFNGTNWTLTNYTNDIEEDIRVFNGSSSTGAGANFTFIDFSAFEAGDSGWLDGGTDSSRSSQRSNFSDDQSQGGGFSWNLQDNTVTSQVNKTFNFSGDNGYDLINITWAAYYVSVPSGNLTLYCDSTLVYSYDVNAEGTQTIWLDPGDRQYVQIFPANCTFDSEVNIRFETEFPGNPDDVFIDGINITGINHTAFAASEDTDVNKTGFVYDNVLGGDVYTQINNITIDVNITIYNTSASASKNNENASVWVELWNGTDWFDVGNMNITGAGLFSITTDNRSVIWTWSDAANRDINLTPTLIDSEIATGFNDTIAWDLVNVTILSEQEFLNDSVVGISGPTNWTNVTKVVSTTEGDTIRWRVWANDTTNVANFTDIFEFVTAAAGPAGETFFGNVSTRINPQSSVDKRGFFGRLFSEPFSLDSFFGKIGVFFNSLSQGIQVNFAAERIFSVIVSISNTFNITTALNTIGHFVTSITQSITLSSTASRFIVLIRSVLEPIVIAFVIIKNVNVFRLVTDTINLDDKVTTTNVTAPAVLNASISQDILLVPETNRIGVLGREVTDLFSINVIVQRAQGLTITVQELLNVNVVVDRIQVLFRSTQTLLNIDVVTQRTKGFFISVQDLINIDSTIQKAQALFRLLFDRMVLAFTTVRNANIFRSTTDTINLDVSMNTTNITGVVSSTADITQDILLVPEINRIGVLGREVTDLFSIDFAIERAHILIVSVQDLLNVNVVVDRIQVLFRSTQTLLNLNVITTRSSNLFVSIQNLINVDSAVERTQVLFVSVQDTISISDRLERIVDFVRSISQLIGVVPILDTVAQKNLVGLELLTPNDLSNLNKLVNNTFIMEVNVSCPQLDCGEISVFFDPRWESDFNRGLISYHSMNETIGNASDVVDGTNNITTFVNAIRGEKGISNNSIRFDDQGYMFNKNDTFDPDQYQNSTEGTVSVWVNWTPPGPAPAAQLRHTVFNFITPGNEFIRLRFDNGTSKRNIFAGMNAYSGEQWKYQTPTNTLNWMIPTGKWTHLVLVHNGTDLKLYVNGTQQTFTNITSGGFENKTSWFGDFNNSLFEMDVGSINDVGTSYKNFFNGSVDELAIWNRSLSSAEISNLYNDGQGVFFDPSPGKGIISTTLGDEPFYTNSTRNPINVTLNSGESQILTIYVNATGTIFSNHTFFVYANQTSDFTKSNTTGRWNVTIVDVLGSLEVRNITESTSVTDTIGKLLIGDRQLNQLINIDIVVTKLSDLFRGLVERISITFNAGRSFGKTIDSKEDITVTTSVDRLALIFNNVRQTISLDTAISRLFSGSRETDQPIVLTTLSTKLANLARSPLQNIIITFGLDRSMFKTIGVVEEITITDSSTRLITVFRELSQTINIDFLLTRLVDSSRGINQDIIVSDRITRIGSFTEQIKQQILFVFDVDGIFGAAPVGVNLVSVKQPIIISFVTGRMGLNFILIDQLINLDSSVGRLGVLFRELKDTFNLDVLLSRSYGPQRGVTQDITLTDVVGTRLGFARSVQDSINLSSGLDRLLNVFRKIDQLINIGESATGPIPSPINGSSVTRIVPDTGVVPHVHLNNTLVFA